MISSLLSPASTPPAQGRISQLLPTVKCSTCHQPVPLAELGEHTCTAPPPVPELPKPAITPEAATALLPGRLQGRVASPSASTPREDPQHQRIPSSGSNRLKISTRSGGTSPTQASFQAKSSPLARSDSDNHSSPFAPNAAYARTRTPSNAGSMSSQYTPSTARPLGSFSGAGSREPPLRNGSPFSAGPMRPGPPPASAPVQPPRMGSPALSMNGFPPNNRGPPPPSAGYYNGMPPPAPGSAGSSINFPPRQGPPPLSAGPQNNIPPNGYPRSMDGPPPGVMDNVGSSSEAFVPPAERGIDTKTGGAAGMAGVGRRGFAAAARAAMFVTPTDRPGGPQPQYGRRPNAPQFLDIDAVSRSASTPPLSAGSGYSSPSPGPTSPLPQVDPRYPPQVLPNNNVLAAKQFQARTPSPSVTPAAKPNVTPTVNTNMPPAPPSAASPLSGRLPFFEKLRGRLPGLGGIADAEPTPPPSDPLPPPPSTAPSRIGNETSANIPIRSNSSSTNHSRTKSVPRREERRPPSPVDSESEYGGLAYADSTDYEDDDRADDFNSQRSNSVKQRGRTPPPAAGAPLSAAASILERASSKSRTRGHMQFGSVSARSRSRSNDRGDAHASMLSHSSYSSDGDGLHYGRTRPRTNSSAVAQALGLSQTPPSDYKRLGGPGIVGRSESRGAGRRPGDRDADEDEVRDRLGRLLDRSASSSKSSASVSSAANLKQRVYGTSIDSGRGGPAPSVSSSSSMRLPKVDTAAANNYYEDNRDDGDSVLGGAGGSKAQRSRTVQGTQSPEAAKKPIKLPMRSLTSPSPKVADKALAEVGTVKKKRVRTCLRCSKNIDDGRWVSVDGGGVLCEKCWKNMYLPKCRRCNLPIERAAVSSSDGQLKGKYHKECFNCHTCHKPFPDKSFYVYDGKPLCAYHYHEANDSLCAAALCGQPIEGPCAVSHTGDRYHPEHMTCEYPGYPECTERLKDYWEVDGRMLCERHAHNAARNGSDEDDEAEWVQSSRAKKRVTRFIDLAGAAGLGAGSGSADGGLRI